MRSFDAFADAFVRDAAIYGPVDLGPYVAELEARVRSGNRPSRKQSEDLLKRLRGERCFAAMAGVTEALEGDLSPQSRLYRAQALIDQDRLDESEEVLRGVRTAFEGGGFDAELADVKARNRLQSELYGLFGRLYKQRFVVCHGKADKDGARENLTTAVWHHHRAYDLDPSWHGANLAALAWRAKREAISLGRIEDPVEQQVRRLTAGWDDRNAARVAPWDLSAVAQSFMAANEWQRGLDLYRLYVRTLGAYVAGGAEFMMMGDLRQLREIWLIGEEGRGPRKEILSELSRRILRNPNGSVTLSLSELEQIVPALDDGETLQAILDDELTMYAATTLDRIRAQLPAVCKIRSRNTKEPAGSGFLVDGQAIGLAERGPVLATAAHVLSADQQYLASTVHPPDAEAHFERWMEGSTEQDFPVEKVVWESPPGLFDVSICRLAGLPDQAHTIDVCARANPFADPRLQPPISIGTVVPLGYPRGLLLTVTFGSNPVLDHDLYRDPGCPRVVHYRADTKDGSSGGPIVNRSGEVVAIHRKHTRNRIPDSPRLISGTYAANEGVGIHCVARAVRSH